MSFSSDARSEVSRNSSNFQASPITLLGSLTAFCGHISLFDGKWMLHWETRSAPVARLLFRLIKEQSQKHPIITTSYPGTKRQGRQYRLALDSSGTKTLTGGDVFSITEIRTRTQEEKKAYLQGAFLGAGSLLNPRKGYHAEFVCQREEHAKRLERTLASFSISCRRQSKKGNTVLYIRDSEQIALLLRILGASRALLDFENVRILRQMRADVNRQVNFETANLEKAVNAGSKYSQIVDYIEKNGYMDQFPSNVQQTAYLRRKYPDTPLEELGAMLEPPASKSAVNHRLRKLKSFYDAIHTNRKENEL